MSQNKLITIIAHPYDLSDGRCTGISFFFFYLLASSSLSLISDPVQSWIDNKHISMFYQNNFSWYTLLKMSSLFSSHLTCYLWLSAIILLLYLLLFLPPDFFQWTCSENAHFLITSNSFLSSHQLVLFFREY